MIEDRFGLTLFATLGTALVALILLTNWPEYQYQIRGGPIPLYYFALPCVLAVPLVFAQPDSAMRLLREPLFWWFAAFTLTGLVWLLGAESYGEESDRQWRLRVLAYLLFCATVILVSESRRGTIAWVIVGCMLLACAFNWFDLLRPFRFVPRGMESAGAGAGSGRGAGMFINPNVAASCIVMSAIAALPFVPMRMRGAVLLAALVGVVPTLSRGGLVFACALIIAAVATRMLSRMQVLLLFVAISALIGTSQTYFDHVLSAADDTNVHNLVRRLSWLQGVDEHDESVEGRQVAAERAWQMFLDDPLTGQGIGATTRTVLVDGPHNMYLLLMAEQGFIGLALYLSLIGLLLYRGRALRLAATTTQGRDIGISMMIFGVFVAGYGLVSHNVLEEAQGIFLMAFIVAAALRSPGSLVDARIPTTPGRNRIGERRPAAIAPARRSTGPRSGALP